MNGFWPRAILHVDMDAFYAAVEQHDHPEYRGRPVIIGGTPEERGVVSTASYEARKFGVHSAMPSATARRLCPGGIFLRGNHHRYAEVSRVIQEIFTRFTPLVQPLSLDEAFLDCSGSQQLFGTPAEIARKIKDTVKQETGLTASVGAASTMFVAKIASDLEKPDGLTVIPDAEVLDRLGVLPIGKIWGVGAVTEKKLHRLGVTTVAELRRWPAESLCANFGTAFGTQLYQLARGIDEREIGEQQEREKSISNETTFARDVTDIEVLFRCLLELAEQVGRRTRAAQVFGRTVQLKVRYSDFTTVTRRTTLTQATASSNVLYRTARTLLTEKTECGRRAVRLLGVGFGNLTLSKGAPPAYNLFPEIPDEADVRREKMEKIELASDKIIARLGSGAVRRGSQLLGRNGK